MSGIINGAKKFLDGGDLPENRVDFSTFREISTTRGAGPTDKHREVEFGSSPDKSIDYKLVLDSQGNITPYEFDSDKEEWVEKPSLNLF